LIIILLCLVADTLFTITDVFFGIRKPSCKYSTKKTKENHLETCQTNEKRKGKKAKIKRKDTILQFSEEKRILQKLYFEKTIKIEIN
jgi:hypothetical protein